MSPTHTVPLAKRLLGRVPALPEAYERALAGAAPPAGGYRLPELEQELPRWVGAVQGEGIRANPGGTRRILILGYLQWWLENTTALSLLFAALGHRVTLAYLPYRHWWHPRARFDVRRQRAYLQDVLSPLRPLVAPVDLLGQAPFSLPAGLSQAMGEQAMLDVQYTLQREDVDPDEPGRAGQLYRLRKRRDAAAAARALGLLRSEDFDVVVLPNGTILEFGAVRQVARHEALPVSTYDFGEQRNRVWLAQDDEVMRLNTEALWSARGEVPLTGAEKAELEELYRARRGGRAWETFARQWQSSESQGAQAARAQLGLSREKKVVLLCTNVVGDSLALDRQVFSEGMAEWLQETVRHLADRPDVQLVVRVHPGELLGAGHPSVEIVQNSMEELPEHVIVIPPESEINTYDLIELAHVGLVYTTTVGMEMAMSGVPVIVAGDAHYRDIGFTYRPDSFAGYFRRLDGLLDSPRAEGRLPHQQELSRRYAYRFFFEYPFPYPWHVIGFWSDIEERPFEEVVSRRGLDPYLETLEALAGFAIDWSQRGTVVPKDQALA